MYKKHYTRFFFLSLMLLSGTLAGHSKVVTTDNAASVASKFYQKAAGVQKQLVLHDMRGGSKTMRLASAAQPAYYVFGGSDGQGFVIVSGDDVARPILGFSTKGSCDDMPPAMMEWLADIESQIRQAQAANAEQTEEVANLWLAPEDVDLVLQLETAKWGQGMPYKAQCPKDNDTLCATGCVTTAYAILMKYFGQPAEGKGFTPAYTTKTKGIEVEMRDLNHPYDWDKMLMEYKAGKYTDEEADAVATLMADIGAAIQADYTNDGTSGSVVRSPVFGHFGYNPGTYERKSDYSTTEWHSLLRAELNKKRPLLYRGQYNDEAGHAFIIDGYTSDNYFSVNWGWNGTHNGLFALDALTPGKGNYNSAQAMCIDLVPASELSVVALVNDTTECTSLMAAISLAPEDGTLTKIKLVDDFRASYVVVGEGKNISLDLNGHELNVDNRGIYNYGELTIADLSGGGVIKMDRGNLSMIYNYGKLTINSGVYRNNVPTPDDADYRRCVLTSNGSTTNIKGGTFTCGYQTLYIGGDATIDGGSFQTNGNNEVVANYSTDGQLLINGGTFTNDAGQPEGTDHRRCLWTSLDTKTVIKGGTFSCGGQVLILRGNTTIDDGEFESTGNSFVVGNYNAEVTINGGTFTNSGETPEGTDSRRCLYTNKDTKTFIKGGTFTSNWQALCFNGDGVVSNGTFISKGNIVTAGNYNTTGTLKISGGTFINEAEAPEDIDNRRCVWGSMNTTTIISGGTFTNEAAAQTLCFYGDATISGGTIENKGTGSGCASNGSVIITDCRISANNVLLRWDGAILTCSGGLYSQPVKDELLAEGCECVDNTATDTKEKYPYKVINSTKGDVNGDGSVDVSDISSVISYISGDESIDETKADVNGDGVVDVADIASVITIMAER